MITFIQNFLLLLLAHYILDYPLQGEFLAMTKGKYFYSLWAHSAIYGIGMTLTFMILGVPQINFIPLVCILVGSHIFIDSIKAHAKDKDKALTTYLYIDQASHILINMVIMAFFI